VVCRLGVLWWKLRKRLSYLPSNLYLFRLGGRRIAGCKDDHFHVHRDRADRVSCLVAPIDPPFVPVTTINLTSRTDDLGKDRVWLALCLTACETHKKCAIGEIAIYGGIVHGF
jgi:hypothetical protein